MNAQDLDVIRQWLHELNEETDGPMYARVLAVVNEQVEVIEQLRAALATESAHVDRLVAANKELAARTAPGADTAVPGTGQESAGTTGAELDRLRRIEIAARRYLDAPYSCAAAVAVAHELLVEALGVES